MLTLLGTALVLLGLLAVLVGTIVFVIAAFRESLLWGLGVVFVPPLWLVFLIVHWRAAKPALVIELWGLAFFMLGVFLAGNDLPWPIG
jgi:hypothetical protein